MSLSKDNIVEILLNMDVDEYGRMAQINMIFNTILNDQYFWMLKYQYSGLSETVFHALSSYNNIEDYVEGYKSAIILKNIANNVLIIYDIESQEPKYSNNYIILKFNDENRSVIEQVLNPLYPEVVEQLESLNNFELYIHLESNKYSLNNPTLSIQLFLNRPSVIELLILYQNYGGYIFDKNIIPYDASERPFINIGDRRAGMIAAIQYFKNDSII